MVARFAAPGSPSTRKSRLGLPAIRANFPDIRVSKFLHYLAQETRFHLCRGRVVIARVGLRSIDARGHGDSDRTFGISYRDI